jgi:cytoskeleton protein RodZ
MTDAPAEYDVPPAPPEASAPTADSAGALLMQARKAAGLSRADVAHKLKFSQRQIETVESADYAALGGNSFVRGFVRTYAKLLGIDAGAVLAALDRSELPPETGPVVADPKRIPFPTAASPVNPVLRYAVISIGVIATCILILYVWHGEELLSGPVVTLSPAKTAIAPAPEDSAVSQPVTLAPNIVQSGPAAVDKDPPVTAGRPHDRAVEKPQELAVEKPQEKSAEMPAVTTAAPAGGGSRRRIVMSFQRDAWVEVKDVNGHILFSQLSLAGTQQVVEGRAPFEVVIGNAQYVSLRYKDAPFDLKPHTRADVARVTLN